MSLCSPEWRFTQIVIGMVLWRSWRLSCDVTSGCGCGRVWEERDGERGENYYSQNKPYIYLATEALVYPGTENTFAMSWGFQTLSSWSYVDSICLNLYSKVLKWDRGLTHLPINYFSLDVTFSLWMLPYPQLSGFQPTGFKQVPSQLSSTHSWLKHTHPLMSFQ